MAIDITEGLGACLGRTKYKAKAELAYEEIRDAILNGILKPGDRLAMDELETLLQVSRMPIREAIKRLEVEGFVTVMPHKGVVVASAVVEELSQMLSVRAALEGFAASEAARLVGPQDIAKLEALCAEMDGFVDGQDDERRLLNNRKFHETICDILDNRFLKKIIANIFDSIQRYRIQVNSPRFVAEQHREIVSAIASRDPDRAERIMRQHVKQGLAWKKEDLGEAPVPGPLAESETAAV